MGPDSLYCGKWRKILKSHHDLDLGLMMPNIKLVRVVSYITMYLNFMFLDQFLFELSCKNTHTQGNTHTHPDKFFIVAFCKNATIYKDDRLCHRYGISTPKGVNKIPG